MEHPALTQDQVRDDPGLLLRQIADGILKFRGENLHRDSAYTDALLHGQKLWAVVSQCADSRQPFPVISGLPLGKLFVSTSIAGFLRSADAALWAKIYYGIKMLGAPVVIKLGHTGCGGAKALIDHCLSQSRNIDHNPTMDWLLAAEPVARQVIAKNPGADAARLQRLLEEDLVRVGIETVDDFLNGMEMKGHLKASERPTVVGMLFEMETAKLYIMAPSGRFEMLSEILGESPNWCQKPGCGHDHKMAAEKTGQ